MSRRYEVAEPVFNTKGMLFPLTPLPPTHPQKKPQNPTLDLSLPKKERKPLSVDSWIHSSSRSSKLARSRDERIVHFVPPTGGDSGASVLEGGFDPHGPQVEDGGKVRQ